MQSATFSRDWYKDWEWASQCIPYRIAYISYCWKDHLHLLDEHTLISIMSTSDYDNFHMRRFKYHIKKEFLDRFVRDHYPLLIESK